MGTSTARTEPDPADSHPGRSGNIAGWLHPKTGRHLRAVGPDELATIAEQAEEATGSPSGFLLGLLAGTIATSLPEDAREALFVDTPDPGPAEVAQWLRAGELLQANLREFMTDLRRSTPTEVNSTEVRKNWADYLELVRASDHTIYITQHGKRVAALVPPYVADSYKGDQEWYWTPEWQEKEQQAEDDLAAGRSERFDASDEFLAALAERVEGE